MVKLFFFIFLVYLLVMGADIGLLWANFSIIFLYSSPKASILSEASPALISFDCDSAFAEFLIAGNSFAASAFEIEMVSVFNESFFSGLIWLDARKVVAIKALSKIAFFMCFDCYLKIGEGEKWNNTNFGYLPITGGDTVLSE